MLLAVVVVVAAAGVVVAMFDTAAIIANVNRVATDAAMTQLLFFLLIRCISVLSTIAIDKRLPLRRKWKSSYRSRHYYFPILNNDGKDYHYEKYQNTPSPKGARQVIIIHSEIGFTRYRIWNIYSTTNNRRKDIFYKRAN